MNIGDWITLAAVIVALGIGVASLIQTNNLRKIERRDKLINEVIGWLIEISSCSTSINILGNSNLIFEKNIDDEEKFRYVQIYGLLEIFTLFSRLAVRGEYIKEVASRISIDLFSSIGVLVEKMNEHIKLIFEAMNNTVEFNEYGKIIDAVIKGKLEDVDKSSKNVKVYLDFIKDRININEYAKKIYNIALEIKTDRLVNFH